MDLTGLEREDLIEIIHNQRTHIEKLQAEIEKGTVIKKTTPVPTRPTLPSQTVAVLGKNRKFRFPTFRFKGEVYRADEVQYNQSLLEEIVKATGDSILKEVN